jgi:hypothetical protein
MRLEKRELLFVSVGQANVIRVEQSDNLGTRLFEASIALRNQGGSLGV